MVSYRTIMAKCVYCDANTEMYVLDSPVCVECSDLIEAGKPPQKKPGSEKLNKRRAVGRA
jgi:hypothetical protein